MFHNPQRLDIFDKGFVQAGHELAVTVDDSPGLVDGVVSRVTSLTLPTSASSFHQPGSVRLTFVVGYTTKVRDLESLLVTAREDFGGGPITWTASPLHTVGG